MPRTESRIQATIWTDNDDFRALSVREQWLYLFLVTQPTISLCGILPLMIQVWAHSARDETYNSVSESLVGLCSIELHPDRTNEPFVIVDPLTEELWVRSFIKNDRVCRSPYTRKAAWEQLNWIRSGHLRSLARLELEKYSAVALGNTGAVAPSKEAVASKTEPSLGAGPSPTKEQVKTLLHVSPSSPPSPSSSNSPTPVPIAIQQGRDLLYKPLKGEPAPQKNPGDQLAERLALICTGTDREYVRREAAKVVAWAAPLDHSVLEEVINQAAKWADKPLVPRAIAKALEGRAHKASISLGRFVPEPSRRALVKS